MHLYIVLSGLYRLSCGALILAINWIMVVSNDTFSYLAILVALTFLPALLVPIFYKNQDSFSGARLSSYALMFSFLTAIVLFFSQNQIFILVLNTVLWFFFFIMESSWESWFASLAKKYTEKQINQFSSLSMSVNQASLMIGPVISAFVFKDHPQKVILMSSLIFLIVSLFAFFLSFKEVKDNKHAREQNKILEEKVKLSGLESSLVLIWPTLAIFNFMLPVQISYHNGNMAQVGILDAVMGFGMIISGVLLAKEFSKKFLTNYMMSILLIILALMFWIFFDHFIFKVFSIFILGLCFNANRIIIRSELAKKYQAHTVGKLVARANSLSFFIIIFMLYFFYNNVSINWLIPFIFTALISLLVFKKKTL